MLHSFKYMENMTPIFFSGTGVLVNVIFYTSLKLSGISVAAINAKASLFNLFQILSLLSIIKLIKKNPKKVAFSRKKYEQHLEAFYETYGTPAFESEVRSQPKSEDEAFDQFLERRGLRFCRTCLVFKKRHDHHCIYCGECVQMMDHHCLWLNQCISRKNIKFFYNFLVNTSGVTSDLFGDGRVGTAVPCHADFEVCSVAPDLDLLLLLAYPRDLPVAVWRRRPGHLHHVG